MDSDSSVA